MPKKRATLRSETGLVPKCVEACRFGTSSDPFSIQLHPLPDDLYVCTEVAPACMVAVLARQLALLLYAPAVARHRTIANPVFPTPDLPRSAAHLPFHLSLPSSPSAAHALTALLLFRLRFLNEGCTAAILYSGADRPSRLACYRYSCSGV